MSEAADATEPGPIRVLMANISGVPAELLAVMIASQPDMLLVGQVDDQVDLLLAVGEGVDVLIFGAPATQPLPGVCSNLLAEFPDLRIVVLAATGEAAALYWLGLRRRRLGAPTAASLKRQIRGAFRLNPVE
ncbi:MAG: hypothetical protein HGA45_39445 [Chloroflexales bacterium]|nr:hypothetical protein [Chloroflexales bacterium]